jgi:hypothetical protein
MKRGPLFAFAIAFALTGGNAVLGQYYSVPVAPDTIRCISPCTTYCAPPNATCFESQCAVNYPQACVAYYPSPTTTYVAPSNATGSISYSPTYAEGSGPVAKYSQGVPVGLQAAGALQQGVYQGQTTKLNTFLTLRNRTGVNMYFIVILYDDNMDPHDSGFFWLPNAKDRTAIVDAAPRYLSDEQAYLMRVVGYKDNWDKPTTWGPAGRMPDRVLQQKSVTDNFEAILELTDNRRIIH